MQRSDVLPYRGTREPAGAVTGRAERSDAAELRAVAQAMWEYERRCEELLMLLADKRELAPHERADARLLYTALKADLRNDAMRGTLSGDRRRMTRIERRLYGPAMRRAAIRLRPATNSHPISSHWFAAVQEALMELSYWLRHVESALLDT